MAAAAGALSDGEHPATPVAESGIRLPVALSATLVLVRHGESTYIAEGRFQGRQDPPLSELGARQVRFVGKRLARRDWGTPLPIPLRAPLGIWHSPLTRAADTARAIADNHPAPIPLHATDALTEIAQGEWEGVPADEVRARWPAELESWRRMPTRNNAPGGEPLLSAAARVRQALAEVVTALADADGSAEPSADRAAAVAAIQHDPVPGYPSSLPAQALAIEPWAVLVAHDGIFRLALMSLLAVPYERFWSFPFNLCGITVVALNHGVATLRAHNLSEHLAPLAQAERAAAEARGDRRGAL